MADSHPGGRGASRYERGLRSELSSNFKLSNVIQGHQGISAIDLTGP